MLFQIYTTFKVEITELTFWTRCSRAGCVVQNSMIGVFIFLFNLFPQIGLHFLEWNMYWDLDTKTSNVPLRKCFEMLFLVCIESSKVTIIVASSVYHLPNWTHQVTEFSVHRNAVNTSSDVKKYYRIISSEKCHLILVLEVFASW